MTGRRRPSTPRTLTLFTSTAVAGALLTTGCGVVPGGSADAGAPVTVMTWAPRGAADDADALSKSGVTAMASAYARWVDSEGGIDGRELKVVTCDEKDTTVGAEKCARQAVEQDVAAVVGSYSRHGRSFLAPLEAAGIPYIGGYGASDEEFSSFVSFPVNGGQSSLLAGNGKQLAAGCHRVALVRPDSIAGDAMAPLLDTSLAEARRGAATDVVAPESATSYDEQARQALAAADDDGCVTAVLDDRTQTFFDSFRRLEPEDGGVRISSVLGSVGQPLIDSTGGANSPFEGAYVTGWYPDSGDARWDPMREVLRAHAFGDNTIDPADTGVQTAWIAYTVLAQAVRALDGADATASRVMAVLNRGLSVDTGGLTPTLRWRYQDMLGSSAYPRIVNGEVTFQVVREGRLVAQKQGFVDVTETLSNARSAAGG
ncbi:ABC transporter substrate-binding protein [uncultured Streptomyces sp.]|uniref:ABC transporter substrate-binding protein n=1 Tax=uncultured Streptomyces sp. TaxID=174707 RepID=UPI0026360281|nr:ABC transporter substrate-binding protein [uncultured Streptomyces sp.]